MFTGYGESTRDDWGAILAGNAASARLAPYLVLGGAAYTHEYTSSVVRVGRSGQLSALLDGTALRDRSSESLVLPSTASLARADALVRLRASRAGTDFGDRYATALAQVEELAARADSIDLTSDPDGCQWDTAADCSVALTCFAEGLSRCALVEELGACNEGWDTHTDNDRQDANFEGLFGYLNEVMEDLAGRTAEDGSPLEDHVTVVVLSEMGRTPRLNGGAGRDHWTYTSAMLLGAGIRGGQVIGGMDDDFLGRPVDLASGEVSDGGEGLLPTHLGATLLAIGDVDPASMGILEPPITAAMA